MFSAYDHLLIIYLSMKKNPKDKKKFEEKGKAKKLENDSKKNKKEVIAEIEDTEDCHNEIGDDSDDLEVEVTPINHKLFMIVSFEITSEL